MPREPMVKDGKILRGTALDRLAAVLGAADTGTVSPMAGDLADVCDACGEHEAGVIRPAPATGATVAVPVKAEELRKLIDAALAGPAAAESPAPVPVESPANAKAKNDAAEAAATLHPKAKHK